MSKSRYRVIQWATGRLGKIAIKHFSENPVFELAGVFVTDAAKVGKDAGEIAGIAPTGITATSDVDAIVALDADCVFYSPRRADLDTICKLLRSGKNVVSSTTYFYPTAMFRPAFDQIEAACKEGGTSFHAGGIHPGFAGDLLPLVLTRITARVDKVQLYEIVNFLEKGTNAAEHVGVMGFGIPLAEFRDRPNLLAQAIPIFSQSMEMVAHGLGKTIEKVTNSVDIAAASRDIAYEGGAIPAGTVAAQHHQWVAYCDGAPLIVYHAIYTMGDDGMASDWQWGRTRYRVAIEGNPPTELTLEGTRNVPGANGHPGYIWTAMDSVNAIPDLCDAAPGVVTHFELGLVRPRGLVRPAH